MPRSLFIDDSDSLPKFVPMSGEEKSQIDINAKSGKHEDVIKPINKDGRDRTVVDSIDQFLSLNDDLSATCTPVPESAQLSKMTNKKEDYQFEEDRTRYIPRSLLMDDDYSLPRFPTDQLSNTPVKDVPQTELGKETEEPEDVINSDTQDLSGLNRFNEFLHLNDDLFATLKSVLAKAVTPFIPRTLYTGCTDSSHDVPNKKEDCRFEKDITIPRNLFNDDDDSLPGPSDQLSNTPGGDNPQTDLDGNEEQEDTEDRSGIDLFNELLHFNENLFAMHTSFPARSVTPFIPRTFYTDYTDNSDEMTNEKEGYRFEEDITQCMPRSLVITDDNSLPSFSGDQLFNKSGKDNPQTVLDEEIAVQGEELFHSLSSIGFNRSAPFLTIQMRGVCLL
ncbi:uncharacterized protein LOC116166223 [Photinus pyralis]|uniref:uncharacterized protein LOC116166223 n=1 Tax=Photinus pyralis TaxID=7054 RepID=UPI001266F724|nr:uncharacterized protein LOC116166223 [Photinus pyralis]